MKLRIPLLGRLRRHPTGPCPECEHDTRLDQPYCDICGYAIVEQARVDITRMKPV